MADDAASIARVHVDAWRDTYRGVISHEILDGLSYEHDERGWRERLRLLPDELGVLVAERDGAVVGFTFVGPCEDEVARDLGEIYAIYLAPSHQGRGIGTRLLAAAEQQLRDRGFVRAVLWVVEDNRRGRRFYEIAGWSADGSRRTECMPGLETPAVRYGRSLHAPR